METKRTNQKGQVLVELALCGMIFVVLALSTFDIARLLLKQHQMTQLAREGARIASQTVNASSTAAASVESKMTAIRDSFGAGFIITGGSYTISGSAPDATGNASLITVSVSQSFKDAFGASFIATFVPNFDKFLMNPSITMPAFVAMPVNSVVINW